MGHSADFQTRSFLMVENDYTDVLVPETLKKLRELENMLPGQCDPAIISLVAKTPFKLASIRDLLVHRVYDISEQAIALFETQHPIPAIILARAAFESAAMMHYALEKTRQCVDGKSIDQIDDDLMRVLLGAKNDFSTFTSINIMTAMEKLDNWCNGSMTMYEDLSEFSHPNWSGCLGSYGTTDEETRILHLKTEIKTGDFPYVQGMTAVAISLGTAIHFFNEISRLMPSFVDLCERDIEGKNRT